MKAASSSLFCSIGSESTILSDDEIQSTITKFLNTVGNDVEDIVLLPPDFTRYHSQAGKITRFICEHYNFITGKSKDDSKITSSTQSTTPNNNNITILPALGTHAPMTQTQIETMFGKELAMKTPSPFMVHDWRNDVVTIGHAPADMVTKATNGMVQNRPWPAQLNKHVWEKRDANYSTTTGKTTTKKPLILSIGQVVPHEVMGMANFNKNLFVGVGGVDAINLSHFVGAVYGMENMMGRANNPLRRILNYASEKFLQTEFSNLWYILTVMGTSKETGELVMRGLYIGNDIQCYNSACDLSLKCNFTMLERSPRKMVVYLSPDEFHSTWLGNKAIYRTRMAIADDGELIILAPGVKQFGEDLHIDGLIRKYGYTNTPTILKAMEEHKELQENLSAVAHLIHGSTEGRFTVTYCSDILTQEEVEGVGYRYKPLKEIMKNKYNPTTLRDGWNNTCDNDDDDEEEFYYISNPALGLWAVESRFEKEKTEPSSSDDSKITKTTKAIEGNTMEQEQTASDNSGGVGGWAKSPPST